MILLQQPGGSTYIDYSFYQKFASMEEAVTTAFTEVTAGMGNLGAVASAIAAIGATFYIGMRVLGHFARAESIDVFPLLRPFAIGFLVLNFTLVTDFIGALIKPVETVTQNMVDIQTTRIQQLEQIRQQKIQEKLAKIDKDQDNLDTWVSGQYFRLLVEKINVYFHEALNSFLKNLFYALFLAARLVILTVRSFFLIVLTIVGPLAFALAIFTGFQDSHLMWIARYAQITLWLPLANILGSIVGYLQGRVIALQVLEMTNNVPDEAASGDIIYLVFMIIATLSYLTIPTISGFIISSSGVGHALQRMSNMAMATTLGVGLPVAGAVGAGAVAGGRAAMKAGKAVVGAGWSTAAALGQTAANYGSYYGNAAKQQFNNMRNISKSSD
jgi:conjugative transposon TraJ protein